jgi:tripartite-type tricarboxylate transporter receptor subunit TctC
MAAKNILVLAASPAFPPNNIAELLDYAKKNPGKLSYGSSGSGSPHHLAGVLLNQMAGSDLVHVAYKGGAPAITDVLGGQLPLVFSSMVAVTAHIKAGKLKALGITEKARVAALPGVPAIAETVADFEVTSWLAFVGPAGLPPAVLQTLNQSITRALRAPDVAAKLNEGGLLVVANSAEQFAVQMKADFDKRGELIRRNNITE